MASSSILVVLLAAVLLCFTSQTTSRPGFDSKVDSVIISDICSKTKDPKVCLQVLKSNPKAASTDLRGLCQLSIDIARANATDTKKFVKKLIDDIKKPSTANNGPSLKAYLSGCYDLYGQLIDTLNRNCPNALKAGDFATLNMYAYDLINDVDTCEDDGKPTPIPKSLYARNAVMKDLSSIIVVVSDRLNQGKN